MAYIVIICNTDKKQYIIKGAADRYDIKITIIIKPIFRVSYDAACLNSCECKL